MRLFGRWMCSAVVCGAVLCMARSGAIGAPLKTPAGRLETAPPLNDSLSGVPIECVDARAGTPVSFRATRVSPLGAIDAGWRPDSTRSCIGSGDGAHQIVLADGSSGAFVGWVDERRADSDIYVQRLTASGTAAEGWPTEGRSVCTAARSQYQLQPCLDGDGGILLVWQDFRGGGVGQIFVQHLNADGEPASDWPEGGRQLCAQAGHQASPHVASDGSGGAYVVWQERRDGVLGLYVQHLDVSGDVVTGWPAQAARLTANPANDANAVLGSDGSGVATIVWRDQTTAGDARIIGVRIAPDATPLSEDPFTRTSLTSGASSLGEPALQVRASGEVIIAWTEVRGDSAGVRAVRLASDGTLDPAWPSGGALLSSSRTGPSAPAIAPLPDSGAYIAWEDYRASDESDIAVQRITSTGQLASGWTLGGLAAVTGDGAQYGPALAVDDSGGVVLTWVDPATSAEAQLLSSRSLKPDLALRLQDIAVTPGHARVTWELTGFGRTPLFTFRQLQDEAWEQLGPVAVDPGDHVVLDDRAAPEGSDVRYRVAAISETAQLFFEPVEVHVPGAPTRLILHRAWGAPARGAISVSLALPRGLPATIELLDLMGRRLTRVSLDGYEPGEHTVDVAPSHHLQPGIYFIRLSQGVQPTQVAKLVYLR